MLIAELDAYLFPLYPEESRHGYSVDKLLVQKVEFYVLYHLGEPVGCSGVQFYSGSDGSRYGELKRMYVREGFRGKGFARQLLQHIERRVVAEDIALLRLETGIHQPVAVSLYEKSGYYRIGPFGEYQDDPFSIFMEKGLGPSPSSTD